MALLLTVVLLLAGAPARAAALQPPPAPVIGRVDGARAEASVLRSPDGVSSELSITLKKGKNLRVAYVENAPGAEISFDTIPAAGFKDLFGDGVPGLAYRITVPALGQTTLRILRYQKPRFIEAGGFPEGELRREGKSWLVLSHERPLGRFFRVACGGSGVSAADALRTDVFAWTGGKFVSVAAQRPAFFRNRASRDAAALAGMDRDKDMGGYLSQALTLYYDSESAGRRQDGWKKLQAALKPRHAGEASCLDQARKSLRAALKIPAAW